MFFIGTVAEYIKLFPVLEEVKKKGIAYRVISSGQNRIDTTDIARVTELNIDLSLSREEDIVKNVFGLFYWFFNTTAKSKIACNPYANKHNHHKNLGALGEFAYICRQKPLMT